MTGAWKEMIFKVPCSPNLSSVSFQRNSPYKQDGGEGDRKGTKEVSASSLLSLGFSRILDGHQSAGVERLWTHLRSPGWAGRKAEIQEFSAFE